MARGRSVVECLVKHRVRRVGRSETTGSVGELGASEYRVESVKVMEAVLVCVVLSHRLVGQRRRCCRCARSIRWRQPGRGQNHFVADAAGHHKPLEGSQIAAVYTGQARSRSRGRRQHAVDIVVDIDIIIIIIVVPYDTVGTIEDDNGGRSSCGRGGSIDVHVIVTDVHVVGEVFAEE